MTNIAFKQAHSGNYRRAARGKEDIRYLVIVEALHDYRKKCGKHADNQKREQQILHPRHLSQHPVFQGSGEAGKRLFCIP